MHVGKTDLMYYIKHNHLPKLYPMVEWLRALISFTRLTIRSSHRCVWSWSGVGSSPTSGQACDTSQILLAGVPDGFSRESPGFCFGFFLPHIRL